jgi:hypothetical protein
MLACALLLYTGKFALKSVFSLGFEKLSEISLLVLIAINENKSSSIMIANNIIIFIEIIFKAFFINLF